ncbi:FAD-binding oxidoreductase [Megasphaera paucivorans]|uniref:Glycolate oxidase n=1 Tax=Megasphaera paucivorans TaxID=349095 RepID=A0A1G9WVJ8_9FIRM|nr:FAD-binding oxidoreductase [Megasphaera paucivorans]SDM88439.1 glycolate oxidase [Megasphaera paucivorans]
MNFNKVDEKVVKRLKEVVGDNYVLTDPEKMESYSHDEVTGDKYKKMPEVVVLPANALEIASIVQLANEKIIPIVPRGAGTGYAASSVPFLGGIVVSTERMNHILEVDEENMIMVTEPGVRTGEVQTVAAKHGYLYAGDPCSGDSSFIGGNVATNAGGNKAVKYGTTRQQVSGIEIVTPKGEITTLGGKLKKDSTGYCLTQLMIGSEGTLGIITKVYLKLMPKPKNVMDLLAVFPTSQQAVKAVPKIIHSGIMPLCVEFMANNSIKTCENFLQEKLPHSDVGNYIIVSVEGDNEQVLEEQCMLIDDICSQNKALETLVADSERIWKARKSFGEADRACSLIFSAEDIVVPPSQVANMVEKMQIISKKYGIAINCVAHAADGNVHADILKENMDIEIWNELLPKLRHEVYTYVYSIGGKLSGEHGIGYKRVHLLEEFANPVELKMMKAVKKALDPNNIMNPGKVIQI